MAQLQYNQHGTQIMGEDGLPVAQMHWGVVVHCVEPTTGVYSGNDLAWGESFPDDYIDLDFESWVAEIYENDSLDDDEKEQAYDELCNFGESGDTHLYGAWTQDPDGNYEANRASEVEDDFSAIYNSNYNTLQVVWSKTVKYGRMCSPCYPGQVDAHPEDPSVQDGENIQAYYALPDGCVITQAQRDQWRKEWENRQNA